MRFRVTTTVCVAAILTGVQALHGQDGTLRYLWRKGDDIRYRISLQGVTTMSGMPAVGDVTIDQNMVQIIRWTIRDVMADGGATVQQTFESARMEMGSPMGKMVYDSTAADKPTDPFGANMAVAMSAMIGESITISIRPSGAVSSVEGMSRILEKMMQTMPQNPMGAQTFNQLKASMGDDAWRTMFEQGFVRFPDKPIKPGDTWTSQFGMTLPMVGAVTTQSTFTLKGVESSGDTTLARIARTTAIKPDPSVPPPSNPMGMSLKFVDSTSEGDILFDVTRGRVLKTTVKSEMPMAMSLPRPDGTQINSKGVLRSTITMELVEK